MRISILLLLGCVILTRVAGQQYASSSIFAHNDYAQENPFHRAYQFRVGYVEADIFLTDGELMVAHHRDEIQIGKTLEVLYLIPLQNEILKNKSWAYADTTRQLSLMIDVKTEGVTTLQKLTEHLRRYPELTACRNLEIVVSGNVPPPHRWNEFATFIHFDGRPGIPYTDDQWKRVSLVSTNFRDHARWNGQDAMLPSDQVKLEKLIQSVHAANRKIRFWGAPDFENGWLMLMKMNTDVIGTDSVPRLSKFLEVR